MIRWRTSKSADNFYLDIIKLLRFKKSELIALWEDWIEKENYITIEDIIEYKKIESENVKKELSLLEGGV